MTKLPSSLHLAEADRIAFVLRRDGPAAARLWAQQTYRIYRRALLGKIPALAFVRSPQYRPKFIASCVELRRFLYAQ